MEVILVAVLLGLIPAFIAKNKGRSFIGWWIYGALLFIIAIIHVLLVKDKVSNDAQPKKADIDSGMRTCPFCSELVRANAIKCKHCGSDISESVGENVVPVTSANNDSKIHPAQTTKRIRIGRVIGSTIAALVFACIWWGVVDSGTGGEIVSSTAADDAIKQYQIVAADGDKEQMCIRSGVVAELYLSAHDTQRYHQWKSTSQRNCKAAGMPY